MTRANTYTLLSLDKYFTLVGINPAHASQGAGSTYFPDINQCSDVFFQYMWQQMNNVSREEIAQAIKSAEDDITAVLGYSPAPVWIEQEVRDYPQYYRRNVISSGMFDVRGMGKSVQLSQGKFIEGGRRTLSLVDDAVAVTRTDDDGDGFKETATVTCNTTVTSKCELKVFFAGESGAQIWEIRPPRSVTLSGGVVTFKFWSWQFLDPDLQNAIPMSTVTTNDAPYGVAPIDIEADASYVTTCDVYREYTDFTVASATFYWERARLMSLGLWPISGFCCSSCGGVGCPACELISQDGCIHVKDANGTAVVPAPATYDSDAGQWEYSQPSVCRDPDLVKFYYRAGEQSQDYLQGKTCEPLSNYLAEAIAMLATAKVARPFCTCNNSLAMTNEWQRDLSFTGSRVQGSYTVSAADLDNPFGTRAGAVLSWKRVGRMSSGLMVGAAV
jgi:hypothetical protein